MSKGVWSGIARFIRLFIRLQCDPGFDLRDIASSVVSNHTPHFNLICPIVSQS